MRLVPRGIIEKMGALGFLGLKAPEKYGGTPGTWVEVGILDEEIARQILGGRFMPTM